MITLEICQKQPFDIIAMTPRGTLGLCCVHIAQLMTHPAIYTLPFTLQLCYKPLGILQRVTESKKVHISNHDVLQKLHNIKISSHDLFKTSTLLDIGPKTFSKRKQRNRNFLLFTMNVFVNNQKLFSSNLVVYYPY